MKKILTLIISIFMLFAVLTACNKGEESIDTSETTEFVETTEETTESVETTDNTEEEDTPNEDVLSLFKDGKSEFTIVQPESPDAAVTKAGVALQKALKKYGSTTLNFYKEGMYKTINNGSMDGPKIVLDVLDNEATSQEIFESLDGFYYSYTIKVSGDSLYIVGGSTEATVNAINYFIDTYLSNKVSSLELEKYTNITITPELSVPNLTITGNSIYDYTIVHYGSYYAEQVAYTVQDALLKTVGKKLPVIKDEKENPEKELEILIGKTSRDESKAVRAEYDRPNVYYDITESNGKLVMMAEGYTTLGLVCEQFTAYLNTLEADHDIVGSVLDEDILDSDNMLERADDTELRAMMWNMAGPDVCDRVDRMEKQLDIILMNFPDVFGTNEFYNGKVGKYIPYFEYMMKELSEYYNLVDSPVDDTYGIPNSTFGDNPQNILYKKGLGLSLSDSGYQLLPPGDWGHGAHWAIFENADGNKFIYSVGHYTESHNNAIMPSAHVKLINQVQEMSGSDTMLPAIITGDLYTIYGNVGYNAIQAAGYKDAQRDASVNANNNNRHGTNHTIEQGNTGTACIDIMFYNSGFDALKFKVLASETALYASDHCPIVTDFKF